ncbi:MAG: hypothetical protein ACEQSA_02120 [Weeksellaceae bacterium]
MFNISIPTNAVERIKQWFIKYHLHLLMFLVTVISVYCFVHFLQNGLGLAYNDARSHLNIGRRVVEGLKPGFAQIGSVWLPLPHVLMIPTIWNDFMWHTGLAGALQSMIAFIATAYLIYRFLQHLGVSIFGRLMGVLIFITNINILYLQSTAMTELLLIATMTAASYYLLVWIEKQQMVDFIRTSFFVMLATLIRYDGWFLLFVTAMIVTIFIWKKSGYKAAEGTFLLFCTLGGFGVILWLLWNLIIFGDPLYFAFGPYSAHAQQTQLADAGILATEHNLPLSIKIYLYALIYNSNMFITLLGLAGAVVLYFDKKLKSKIKLGTIALFAPLVFNVIALYFGHSVLFVQGISGNSWFNVRYGIMLVPSIAIFAGYLLDRARASVRIPLLVALSFVLLFSFVSYDAVTIDDGRVGSSQKNVTEVSGWLAENAKDKEGFILISAASHDAILFSSGLPMKKFIHEGTGDYWDSAIASPDRWARWIILRTNDDNDQTFRLIKNTPGFKRYKLIKTYPFADIYQLDDKYLDQLNTTEVFPDQN